MKFLVVFLCALVALSAAADQVVRYDNHAVYKVSIDNEVQLSIAKLLDDNIPGFTIWRTYSGVGSDFDIMVSPTVLATFTAFSKLYSFRTKLLIPDVQKLIDSQSKTKSADAAFGWDSYQTLDEIYAWLDQILAAYPTVTSSFVVGKSYEGRDIRGIKIAYPYGYSAVFLEGNSIAREWITSATLTYLVNEILTNREWRSTAENVIWYIVPVLNVDGYVYSHKYNRLWRKTRKPHLPTNCVGADLSRNFNYKWMENQGGSGIPCSEFYAGTEALSEPESKAFTTYVRSLRFVHLFISFRAYGQHILVPYAYSSTIRPRDYNDLLDIATKTAKGIKNSYGTVYTTGAASNVVGIASGNVVDWGNNVIADRPATLTYVLPDTGQYGYLLPAELIVETAKESVIGIQYTINAAMHNYIV